MFTRPDMVGVPEWSPKSELVSDTTWSSILDESLAVSVAMIDGKVSENAIYEILAIISNDDFDAELFRMEVGSLRLRMEKREKVI